MTPSSPALEARAPAPVPWRSRRPTTRIGAQNLSLLAALAILVAIFGVQEPYIFFRPANLVNIGSAIALLTVLSAGQTLVILGGGLDISIGANVALSSVVAAWAMANIANNMVVGVLAGIACGLVAGLVNGLLITLGRVNPVIATLGTLSAFSGLAFIAAGGRDIPILNRGFSAIGLGSVARLPYPLVVAIVTTLVFALALRFTDIGRNVYALGGNPVAARLAGISLNRYMIGIYAVAGVTAGIGGILLASRTQNGVPSAGGVGLELEAITAVVLGGAALTGGRGTIVGTVFGVLLIGVLKNGLTIMNVQTFYQDVATGVLLVVAVMIQQFGGRWKLPWRRIATT
jgi:ribose/xylose/arabinose/galactoside ABC-type transport system permease subunit